MLRVFVYRFLNDGIDDSQLLALLEAAECELIEEDDTSDDVTGEKKASGTSAEALLVILTPELLDDDGLEEKLVRSVDEGCRIVCIWPSGAQTGTAPASIDKYSADQTIWDAGKLRRAVIGASEPSYDTPAGQPRVRPDTPTNIC